MVMSVRLLQCILLQLAELWFVCLLFFSSLMQIANAGHFNEGLRFAYIHDCIDLYCENPRLFRKVVVPVDPVDESGDEIVGKMALSFARASFEAREVGAGEADATVVEQSWRFHFQLSQCKFRWAGFVIQLQQLPYIPCYNFCAPSLSPSSQKQDVS